MRYTTSDGKKWYLYCKTVPWVNGTTRVNYFFSKNPEAPYRKTDVPEGYKVFQSKVGMPMLKKI